MIIILNNLAAISLKAINLLGYRAGLSPSYLTIQEPSVGNPGAVPVEPSQPAAIIATAYNNNPSSISKCLTILAQIKIV